jgi:2-polyprenyl-6-methoxyphenol hydroxylase-like FAD-dependent oxidoreductase
VGDTALIIGGGFAGMLAARVAADFFRRVVVCEKDAIADDARPRRGVPQGPHIHGPLLGTIQILSELFSGLRTALAASGAATVNTGIGIRTFIGGRWTPQRDFGLSFPMQTRGLLEHVMRMQLSSRTNVLIRRGCRVVGLMNSGDRIAGVAVRDGNGMEDTIEGDLVIDASGRGSRVVRWLADLGYEAPRVSQINIDVRYVSCLVGIPRGYPDAHIGLRIREGPRTGACFPVEDNKWIVSLSGRFGDYPPAEVEGMIQFAETFSPEIAQRVRAGVIGELASFYFPCSLHRHFESMPRLPQRFLPIGDTVMCLNPVYGQGMATAGIQAKKLAAELTDRRNAGHGLDEIAAKVLPRYVDVLDYLWRAAAIGDFSLDQTTGDRPAGLTESGRFAEALAKLAHDDAEVHRIALRVQQLLDPPEALIHSGIRDRVLAGLES